jgi:glycosyltransferase involved in cell wall biosynthesis
MSLTIATPAAATPQGAPRLRDLTEAQFREIYDCDRFTAIVLSNRLRYVVQHMSTGLSYSAFSPIIRDWYDFAITVSGPPDMDYPMPAVSCALLVFLGTLAPHKGPHLVRAAWQRAGVRAPLKIHGPPGPDAAYVAALPNDGPVPTEEVPRLLHGARALVLGSVWPENAPLVVLEARAVGCPVIAPAVGGLHELVEHGVDGWLYPPGDIDALAECLRAAAASRPAVRPPTTFAAHIDAISAVYAGIVQHE